MKVLLVAPMPPVVDGLATYSVAVATAYRSAGHEVAVVSSDDLGRISLEPVRALRWRPDVVHVQHTIATYGLRLLALWTLVALLRLRGVFVLITQHEVTRDVQRLGRAGLAYYAATARFAQLTHVHTTQARGLFTERLRLEPSSVVVSPHPVFPPPELERSVPEVLADHGLDDGRRIILQFGFVNSEKGIRDTIEAYGELLHRRPDLRETTQLVIAGHVRPRPPGFGRFEAADRDYLAELHAAVARLALDEAVTFTGLVPEGDVRAWFEAASLAVLPYRNAEQSGVANLAIATGTPLLATDAGGLGELLVGLPRIERLDAADYATDLERALDDPRRLEQSATEVYGRLVAAGDPALLIAYAGGQSR